jgi:hypothetical protein
MLNDQLTLLGACVTDEVIRGTKIKKNDDRVTIP